MSHPLNTPLPKLLQISRDGTLSCADGRDVKAYFAEMFGKHIPEGTDQLPCVLLDHKGAEQMRHANLIVVQVLKVLNDDIELRRKEQENPAR